MKTILKLLIAVLAAMVALVVLWFFRGSGPIRQEEEVLCYKPIIYLYPEEETDLTVTLSAPDRLTCTYPDYADGWQVTAEPDGTLTDGDGRSLYALYWEGERPTPTMGDTGFCVPKDEIAAFLEEKLVVLGLNDREKEEFIVYWLPRLTAAEYACIRFESMEEICANQTLTVTPAPDTLIRVSMVWKGVDEPVDLHPQTLTPAVRSGFTAVEWGGSELP